MNPLAIAALVEQLATLAVQIYTQVRQSQLAADGTTTLQPIATLLADADAKFAQVEANSADVDAPIADPEPPVTETKTYADGTTVTGPGPLPDLSPVEQSQSQPIDPPVSNATPSAPIV